jgi:hypothetical protein
MIRLWTWLDEHSVTSLRWLLAVVGTLTVSVLSTALPKLKLTTRIPAVIAATAGSVAVFFGALLLIAKLLRPHYLQHLPWLTATATLVAGVVLCTAALFLRRIYLRRTRQRLQPMAYAAFRTIEQLQRSTNKNEYIESRTPRGRLVAEELVKAARRRHTTRLILLVGLSGAGKSATLAEIACRCQAAWHEEQVKPVFPIYFDLADTGGSLGRKPLRDFLLTELTTNTQLADQFSETWSSARPDATWLLIFDHLDLPFPNQEGDPQFKGFIESINDLLATSKNICIILADRQLPTMARASIVEIAPFNKRQRDRFLELRGVSAAYQATLSSEKVFRQYVGNPGWLDFISPSLLQRPGLVLDTFYDVMQTAMAQLLSEDNSAVSVQMRSIINTAQHAAAYFSTHNQRQGSATKEGITKYIEDKLAEDRETIEGALEFLRRKRIIRLWNAANGVALLSFKHDSIQDYFTVSRLREDPSTLTEIGLLTDARWFTVAVSALQHGPTEMVAEIIRESVRSLEEYRPPPQAAELAINSLLKEMGLPERPITSHAAAITRWPTAVYRVLTIVNAGSQYSASMIPVTIHDLADFHVANAAGSSTPVTQAQMTEIQHLLSADVAAAVCSKGLSSSSGQLVNATLNEIVSRSEIADLLSLRNRLRLMLALAVRGLDSSARHDANPDFALRLRLASNTGVIASWLFSVLFGLIPLAQIAANPPAWSSYSLEIAFAAGIAGGVVLARKTDWGVKGALGHGVALPYGAFAILAVLGGLGLISLALEFVALNWAGLLSSIVFVGALLWPVCALYYLAAEEKPIQDRWKIPFFALMPFIFQSLKLYEPGQQRLLPTKRTVVGWTLTLIAAGSIILLGAVNQKGWHIKGISSAASTRLRLLLDWGAGIAFGLCIIALPVADWLHDWRWPRQWIPPISGVTNDEILEWLGSQRTPYGFLRVAIELQHRLPPEARTKAVPLLEDVWRCLEWVRSLDIKKRTVIATSSWASLPQLATDGLANWLRGYDRQHPGRLSKIVRRDHGRLGEVLVSMNALEEGPRQGSSVTSTDGLSATISPASNSDSH